MDTKTIWTTLWNLSREDLVRNRKQYTIKLDHCTDLDLNSWIQMDAQVARTAAYVDSPEGFGPPHQIKLQMLESYFFTKEDVIRYILMRSISPCWRLNHYTGILTGHKVSSAYNVYTDPYVEIAEALDDLEYCLPIFKDCLKRLYKMTHREAPPDEDV